jgi:hypothetical protein
MATDGTHSDSNWVANMLMIVGGLILVKAITDYWAARRMEMAIIESQPAPSSDEQHGDNETGDDIEPVEPIRPIPPQSIV